MNAILLLAATFPILTSSLDEVGPVSRREAAQTHVSQVLKKGHVYAFRSLTAIARTSGRDQEMEIILKNRLDEEATNPKIESLAPDTLSRTDIRCSIYACELSYEPSQRINMFEEKSALIALVKATTGFDSLDVTPSVSEPGNASVLHVFFLRNRFFEYPDENAENSGRPDQVHVSRQGRT